MSAPSGRYSPSCSSRSSLTWETALRSPISSRKSVPPAACSSSPARASSALVKAPFLWPKRVSAKTWSSRHVDGHEVPPAAAQDMHRPRHELLAHPGLARDQQRPRAGRHRFDVPEDREHRRADGHDAGEGLGPAQAVGEHARLEPLVLAVELAQLDAAFHAADEAARLHRFDDVVEGALAHAPDRGVDVVGARDHDHGQSGVVDRDPPQELLTREVGHPEVEQHDLDLLLPQNPHHLTAVVAGDEVVQAGGAQRHLEARQRQGLIVHQQDRARGVAGFAHGTFLSWTSAA